MAASSYPEPTWNQKKKKLKKKLQSRDKAMMLIWVK
jgi:hypothetical protein